MKNIMLSVFCFLLLSGCQSISIREAAYQGDIDAQLKLERMYQRGEGVKQDVVQAAIWRRMSTEKKAKQGDSDAQFKLGNMYMSGHGGGEKNMIKAVSWFRRSAEQGNANGQKALGDMYKRGRGIPLNYKLAYVWLSVATANGHGSSAKLREEVARHLSLSDLNEGQVLAGEYFDKYSF
ncbi:tetratricopeptide repeat protein [Oceanisphaera pacifica]|uniref:Sel1 repeat family protein n=1 Tax=Oceanisphaera pacifica TaxID=2818389 RepID=A0ABS3NG75_9GAMM|nr:tetratricopeptide repeat protein [Oceanisphaera pacifica]MBO1519577.1 sel1 repeat family protein [Oceanisphaera pacifica]